MNRDNVLRFFYLQERGVGTYPDRFWEYGWVRALGSVLLGGVVVLASVAAIVSAL